MARTHDQRFEGSDNAGLRKAIREAAAGHETGEDRARAVLSLGRTVALTAGGRHTLEQVAEDYRG